MAKKTNSLFLFHQLNHSFDSFVVNFFCSAVVGALPAEPVKAICCNLPTQQAAYDLLVALSAGCVANLEELCHLQEELFYKGEMVV